MGILHWWANRRVKRILDQDSAQSWSESRRVWARAGYVDRGANLRGSESVGYQLVAAWIKQDAASAEKVFREGLRDGNAQVCAYCIVGLELLGAKLDVASLPNPDQVVEWRMGRSRGKDCLRDFAAMSEVLPAP